MSEQLGDRANLAYCLEGLAMVAGARGRPERSARLSGAAEGLHGVVGAAVYNYRRFDRSLYEQTASATRAWLGEPAFEAARAEGRAMSAKAAVAYAPRGDGATPHLPPP